MIDTHSSSNGYIVRYIDEFEGISYRNFDVTSIPDEYIGRIDDLNVGFVIAGMKDNTGEIEYWHVAFPY